MTVTQERAEMARVPGTEILSQWVQVTPAIAEEWLLKNTRNRHVRQKHLERLVADIRGGRYLVNHQGVAFDTEGVLIDGQHRLLAICQAKTPLWMLVTHGLPAEAQVAVDQQSKRSAADFLSGKYTAAKTGALRLLIAVEKLNGVISYEALRSAMLGITITEIHDAAERYMEQIEYITPLVQAAAKYTKGKCGPSALIAAAVMYPDVADKLLGDIINNGAGLPTSDPVMGLLRWQGTGHVQVAMSSYVAIKVFRARHFELDMSVLRALKTEQFNAYRKTRYVRANGNLVEAREVDKEQNREQNREETK